MNAATPARPGDPARPHGPASSGRAPTPGYNARMPGPGGSGFSTLVLALLAVAFAVIAYLKDPGLPWIGAKTGLSLIWSILPRLIPALILAGMIQVLIPQDAVTRYFGRGSGLSAILMATVAGILTPGGPMVSVPLLVV